LEVAVSVLQSWARPSLALQELNQYKLPLSHFLDAWLAQLATQIPLEQTLPVAQVPQLIVAPQLLGQSPHL
jgi:hypothetical protein